MWALRFALATPDADGKPERAQETIGKSREGCDRREAEAGAERVLAMVKLGQYRTREQRAVEAAAKAAGIVVLPTFEEFAEEWLGKRRVLGGKRGRGLSESAEADLTWRLGNLYGWFGSRRLDEITERDVDAYATASATRRFARATREHVHEQDPGDVGGGPEGRCPVPHDRPRAG